MSDHSLVGIAFSNPIVILLLLQLLGTHMDSTLGHGNAGYESYRLSRQDSAWLTMTTQSFNCSPMLNVTSLQEVIVTIWDHYCFPVQNIFKLFDTPGLQPCYNCLWLIWLQPDTILVCLYSSRLDTVALAYRTCNIFVGLGDSVQTPASDEWTCAYCIKQYESSTT